MCVLAESGSLKWQGSYIRGWVGPEEMLLPLPHKRDEQLWNCLIPNCHFSTDSTITSEWIIRSTPTSIPSHPQDCSSTRDYWRYWLKVEISQLWRINRDNQKFLVHLIMPYWIIFTQFPEVCRSAGVYTVTPSPIPTQPSAYSITPH